MLLLIEKSKPQFDQLIERYKQELKSIRTGRATPALLDHCMVEAYGVKTPLRELASISVADARTLAIQPWDKNIMKDVEKGMLEARVGGTPVVDGAIIRLQLPILTEETRKELTKTVTRTLEEVKQALRRVRDTVREHLATSEKEGGITEDDRYRGQKDLDTLVQEYQSKLLAFAEEKTKEIMTI